MLTKQEQTDAMVRMSVLLYRIVVRCTNISNLVLEPDEVLEPDGVRELEALARAVVSSKVSTETAMSQLDWIVRCWHQVPASSNTNILDWHHDWIAAKVAPWLLANHATSSLVDIGGGRGDLARLLGTALGLAKEKCVCVEQAYKYDFGVNDDHVTFCRWDGLDTNMDLPDASADLVLALHHMTPAATDAAVRNAHRILRPGGLLLLKANDAVTPVDFLAVQWEHYMYRLMDAFPRSVDVREYLKDAGQFRSIEQWNETLLGHGFTLKYDMTRTFGPLVVIEEDPPNPTRLYWQVWCK